MIPSSAATNGAKSVREYGPFDGTVKEVAGNKLTISPDSGGEIVLTVYDRTKLLKDGKPTTLASFTPGAKVRCVYDLHTDRLTWFAVYVDRQRPPRTVCD